jgi:hypothetical protein
LLCQLLSPTTHHSIITPTHAPPPPPALTRYGYERDLLRYLEQLIRDMDKKIKINRERADKESMPKWVGPGAFGCVCVAGRDQEQHTHTVYTSRLT